MFELNDSSPKYHQLKEFIKDQILCGEILPGEKITSENTLARQFKLSRHTVRQALGELENEGFICREKGRGTFCSFSEKNVVKNIAVLTTYISDYIFPEIIRGIEEVLSNNGYNLILANTNNDKLKEAQCLENFLNQEIGALIIEPTKSALENLNIKYFNELEAKGIPYLMFHAYYPNLDPAYIIMDDVQGAYLATNHLLQLGHRRIAGIFKNDDLQGVKRQAGFLSALKEYGITENRDWIGNYSTEQILTYPYQFIQNLLRQEGRPTAVVCYNDQIALEVLEAIRNEGLKVPDDVSVVGFDDSSLATATEIKLTTVRHPKAEMGRQVGNKIIKMLTGSIIKPRVTYPSELVIRSSCRNIK
ncbi:MAG: GntR family transcriptional regulator [Bacteroidota bacterium]